MTWIGRPLLAVLMGWICGCTPVAAAGPLKVLVMIQPQRYFVEQIGGSQVSVTVLVPPGVDPHTYEPKPQTMVLASQASLYVGMGIPEEQSWLPRLLAIQPNLRVVRQDEGITKVPMDTRESVHGHQLAPHDHAGGTQTVPGPDTTRGGHDHPNHGTGHHHHHSEALDPHIWLSPKLASTQAETIARALAEVDPANAGAYRERLKSLLQRITDLDQRLTSLFASLPKPRGFLVVHPSWGYFARDYDLEQVPMEIEGKEPTAGDLVKLIQRTASERIPVILVEPQFSQRFATVMAHQSGVQVLVADPLALDWEQNLWEVARQLAERLSGHP
jgi:zinc transport system substrate-binding protein